MLAHLRPALVMLLMLTIITGVFYPLAVTGLAQLFFPYEANGSVLVDGDRPNGSELIGQAFVSPKYFWGRPSATPGHAYNAAASSGSNLGPTNPAFLQAVKERIEHLREAHPGQSGPVPADLVTASASGLDPHLSAAAAEYQAQRVAQARGLSVMEVRQLIAENTEGRALGVLGEPRVNVLQLNLALDRLASR
jgi:K+-transporting ATPase ATPase C chain